MVVVENKRTKLCIYCWKKVREDGFILCKKHEDEWERSISEKVRRLMHKAICKHWDNDEKNSRYYEEDRIYRPPFIPLMGTDIELIGYQE